ncbi:hypothetical protein chiPu_0029214, partial [Chiloscyllium punctatum]|nr:hypothetical protein [Chiloscyllium punctatum]
DMGEGRVAAEHLAATDIHHAAADGAAQLEPDLVKPFKQAPCPRQPTCNRYLAWFITQRNRFRPKAAHKDSR